jgi:hypothetical protein
MAGLKRVRASVTIGRAIATAHLATVQADAQMQPATAGRETVLATVDRGGQLRDPDPIEMRAGGHDHNQTRRSPRTFTVQIPVMADTRRPRILPNGH